MGLRTGEQYVEGFRHGEHSAVCVWGKKVEDVASNLFLKPSVLSFKATFDAAFREDTGDLARVYSPIVGGEVNRFNSLHQGPQGLVAKVKLLRELSHVTGTCFQRCVGWDALNTLYIVTRETADRDVGKVYYDNFMKYLEYVQRRDLALAGAMTDAKGVRTLKPGEEPNPDAYVRVVEERDGGVVVRGAKANITGVFDLKNPEVRQLIEKYLQGVPEFAAEDKLRMVRLLENVSLSVAYLVESVHGAGSPQARRISIQRIYDFSKAEEVAKYLARISKREPVDGGVEPRRATEAERL